MTWLRLALAVAVAVAAVGIAALLRRRRVVDAPSQPVGTPPVQLDRADFPDADADWLVVVFSSASCHSCADVVAKARALASDYVAVREVEYTEHRDLHARYSIDAVPTLVVCDREGVARAGFMGPVTATDLWAAVAEARNPGAGPAPC